MLEPEYSIPQLLDAGAVPPGVGFLAALEAQGYLADPGAAPTTVLDGWSVAQAAASGAAAAKLLLPYHPDHPSPSIRSTSPPRCSPSVGASASRSCSNRCSSAWPIHATAPPWCSAPPGASRRSAPTC